MIGSLIKFIDSLFYTTTVRTILIKHLPETGDGEAVATPQAEPVVETQQMESSVTFEGDHYRINGEMVKIPKVVLDRKPFMNQDGVVAHDSFPEFRDMPILISSRNGQETLVTFDGRTVSRNMTLGGYTRRGINQKIAMCRFEATDDSDDVPLATACVNFAGGELCVTRSPLWVYVRFTSGYVNLELTQSNPLSSPSECIVAAHAYARAMFLTMDRIDFPTRDIDEDDLATVILAMIMVERV